MDQFEKTFRKKLEEQSEPCQSDWQTLFRIMYFMILKNIDFEMQKFSLALEM